MALDSCMVIRLCNWAYWANRGVAGGIGWAKQSAYLNELRGTDNVDYAPFLDEEACETDLCVNALSVVDPELYCVIYAHYIRNDLKVDEKLRYLGCSKQTYYNKIDAAHRLILGWLNDLSCGVGIPAAENNFNKFKKIA